MGPSVTDDEQDRQDRLDGQALRELVAALPEGGNASWFAMGAEHGWHVHAERWDTGMLKDICGRGPTLAEAATKALEAL